MADAIEYTLIALTVVLAMQILEPEVWQKAEERANPARDAPEA